MDDGYIPGMLIGIMVGALIMGVSLTILLPDHNDAYTKGITDCRSGKVSYTVTVGPEGWILPIPISHEQRRTEG